MPHRRKHSFRRWLASGLVVVLWIILAGGWSAFLIVRTFERDMNSQLLIRAHQVARLAEVQLAQNVPAPGTQAAPDLEAMPLLQDVLDDARHLDSNLEYAIVWNAGVIEAQSPASLNLPRPLPPDRWPALDSQQSSRISDISISGLAKSNHGEGAGTTVTEATVPLNFHGNTVAYVSVAYSAEWLYREFWRVQRGPLMVSSGVTLGGVLVLLIALRIGTGALERRRRVIQQTSLARTSMLTERGMLASVLAHEVRSPLTALRFNLHSLRTLLSTRSTDADRQVELTDRCEREIRRLDGMLNDFLQRTQVIGPVESASVNNVVREAIEFLRPALERKNIRVSVHLDANNPHVHAHPDELRQVILNLAANGQDAMPRGGTLAVSTLAESDATDSSKVDAAGEIAKAPNETDSAVTILIRDSGTGIPPELHQRIFEPFFSTKPNGSGLGLALVRRVVSGAGGTVFCESVVGEGTTFRIVLPRAQNEPAVQAGQGYAHIHRDDPAIELDATPELVIDRSAERAKDEPAP